MAAPSRLQRFRSRRGPDVRPALSCGGDRTVLCLSRAIQRRLPTPFTGGRLTCADVFRQSKHHPSRAEPSAPAVPGQTEIVNTIFYQNTGPVWVSSARDLDMRNSIVFNSPFAALAWGDGLYVSDNGSTIADLEAAGGGADNPGIVDPRLVNPQAGDFALATDSPARDAGTSNVEEFVNFDLLGHPRVSGPAVDLGPIESQ